MTFFQQNQIPRLSRRAMDYVLKNPIFADQLENLTITDQLTMAAANGAIESSNYVTGTSGYRLDHDQAEFTDATFAGSLSAASGTFAGSLSAAGGTFAGSLSAVTGSLGDLTVSGTLTVSGGLIRTGSGTYRVEIDDDHEIRFYWNDLETATISAGGELRLIENQSNGAVLASVGGPARLVAGWGATETILSVSTIGPAIYSTAKIIAPSGSATSPTYTFSESSGETGMYRSATSPDAIGFTIQDTVRLQISASWLDVNGGVRFSSLLGGADPGGSNLTFYPSRDVIGAFTSDHVGIIVESTLIASFSQQGNNRYFFLGGQTDDAIGYDVSANEHQMWIADTKEFSLTASTFKVPNVYSGASGTANVVVDSDGTMHLASSSVRWKDNVRDWTPEHSVLELAPKRWEHPDTGQEMFGFTAEDVAVRFPEAANLDDEGLPLWNDTTAILAGLLHEVRELRDRVDALA